MVRLRPVTITLCIASKLYDEAKVEIASDFAPEEAHYLSQIQLRNSALSLGQQKAAEHGNPQIASWAAVSTAIIVSRYADDPQPFIEAFASRENISLDKATIVLFTTRQVQVIESPCLPPMYDWELEPQGFTFPHNMILHIFSMISRFAAAASADGMLTVDAANLNPQASAALRAFMAQNNKEVYCARPLIPQGHPAPSGLAVAATGQADHLKIFMDEQLKTRGERSLIYVSFGSLWWPLDLPKLVAALQVFVEQKIPFIIALSSPVAKLPDDFVQKLKDNPDVYLGDWLPQQAILDQPALGWCLTHGGHNTVLECINSGVPIVNRPLNAIYLSENLDVAYELIQKPLGTLDAVRDELRDVLVRAFGADGAAKRERLQDLRETLGRAWSDGEEEQDGVAQKEVEAFLDHVCALPVSTLNPPRDA
ncbi:hypothetical protein BD414DRAFT_536502 [Trametes punicea]|nr:hypothetical protein BD414DRAFT_536502 [Trametes punicea]